MLNNIQGTGVYGNYNRKLSCVNVPNIFNDMNKLLYENLQIQKTYYKL